MAGVWTDIRPRSEFSVFPLGEEAGPVFRGGLCARARLRAGDSALPAAREAAGGLKEGGVKPVSRKMMESSGIYSTSEEPLNKSGVLLASGMERFKESDLEIVFLKNLLFF